MVRRSVDARDIGYTDHGVTVEMNLVTHAVKESKLSSDVDHHTAQWVPVDWSTPDLNNAS
jgi:hypothetical protein